MLSDKIDRQVRKFSQFLCVNINENFRDWSMIWLKRHLRSASAVKRIKLKLTKTACVL